MSQARYQITLSLDGNHSVSVFGDDPTSVKAGLAWAKGVYDKLKERSQQQPLSPSSTAEVSHHDSAPLEASVRCAIHKLPMVRMDGKRGAFWSCHEKLEDGSWCPYKPGK
jgi:hypothetical protein